MHRRAGFTMVELLVALVISGILATVIFQVVQGQGRFVQYQNARESVQQSTRGGLEMLTSELRGIPAGGLVSAADHAIGVRVPVAWGIVCQAAGAAATSINVAFPIQPINYTDVNPLYSRVVADVSAPGTAAVWSGVMNVTGVVAGAAGACGGAPAGSEVRTFTVSGTPGVNVPVGSRLLFFEWVQYSVAADAAGDRWILRQRGNDPAEKVRVAKASSEPGLLGGNGVKFLFYTDVGGNTPVSLPLSDPNLVRRIGVAMATESRRKVGTQYQQQVDTAFVFLRNRP